MSKKFLSKIFADYAAFYDHLYQDKDYKEECDYLEKIFAKYSPQKIKTILDLGCGTGNHDIILAKKGYKVTGVDCSKNMLDIAKKKAKQNNLKINFFQGDIRKTSLKKKFDAVISMFAVMSYQITNSDFEETLRTANKHLVKNGLLIFDVWFGLAVLADKPKDKIKKVKVKDGYIVRKTKSKFDLLKQVVDVCFKTKYYSSKNRLQKVNEEIHKMRFFFFQEIKYFLQKTDFKFLAILPFLQLRGIPSEDDWNIIVIAQKN